MNLNDAIRKFDLEAFLSRHAADPISDREWLLTCPECGKDEKLSVNVHKKTWHCWVCEEYGPAQGGRRKPIKGAGGLIDLVAMLEGVARSQAITSILAGAVHEAIPIGHIDEELKSGIATSSEFQWSPPIEFPPCLRSVADTGILPYCVDRGISLDDARVFGLGWCDAGRYAGRLVFPVWEQGRFVYFQARAMWEPTKGERFIKSLNPPKMDGAAVSSDVLMNLDTASRYPRVCLTEGPVDAIHAGPDAVCTFGKKISTTQIGKLLKSGVRAIDLMWDADARDDMLRVAPLLASLFDVRLVFLPAADPGEYPREQLNQFRAQAIPAAQASSLAQL